ncbi:P-loop containing nucleoside triphosphate hydrolase protein [Dacryopinax primogenitus]|uniref:p-loop containing nucleoside triphosphate hydrolase protein n=1 Tax=Dacryopinax primogenitus (strain DJM 731) TaxID=1858805 RepID=M5FXT4_DACPD|nr:P-loop containing nucleoside triphosphate hydrolase protein [Dacryopinax primogenitus]EJT98341.1 P-loop containing nucleoside triphosphate hydrolase protein [Dacryopinax primogenitus]
MSPDEIPPPPRKRVIMIGVGGATCSGKTTLAKYLKGILPRSLLVHQDDFAPPRNQILIHPIYKMQDWDAPAGAIDWPRLRQGLQYIKDHGRMPEGHKSHDHLNVQELVGVDAGVVERWRERFAGTDVGAWHGEGQAQGGEIQWVLVDGFLMYWDQAVIDLLDVRLFLRVPRSELARRRHARHGYHTAEQFDYAEGTLWRDPPYYFEQIVWPAYCEAHAALFVDGDVEGRLKEGEGVKVEGLVELDGGSNPGDMLEKACPKIWEVLTRQREIVLD